MGLGRFRLLGADSGNYRFQMLHKYDYKREQSHSAYSPYSDSRYAMLCDLSIKRGCLTQIGRVIFDADGCFHASSHVNLAGIKSIHQYVS